MGGERHLTAMALHELIACAYQSGGGDVGIYAVSHEHGFLRLDAKQGEQTTTGLLTWLQSTKRGRIGYDIEQRRVNMQRLQLLAGTAIVGIDRHLDALAAQLLNARQYPCIGMTPPADDAYLLRQVMPMIPRLGALGMTWRDGTEEVMVERCLAVVRAATHLPAQRSLALQVMQVGQFGYGQQPMQGATIVEGAVQIKYYCTKHSARTILLPGV